MWRRIVRLFSGPPKSHASAEAESVVRRLWEARVLLWKDVDLLERAEKRIKSMMDRQRSVAESLAEDVASCAKDVDRARRDVDRAEKALELLRAENEVLENVVVPALTSGCKSIQERWNADIAASGFKRAMATPNPNREEF